MCAILVVIVLVVAIGFVFRLDNSEQTVRFAIGARSEVQVGGDARVAGSTEGQAPQAVNRHRTFFRTPQQAEKFAVRSERHDRAAAKVANQQFVRIGT